MLENKVYYYITLYTLRFGVVLCTLYGLPLFSLNIRTYGYNLYIVFYLCKLVGLLPLMLKLFHMNLCGFMHIRLHSLCMGTILYILFYLCELTSSFITFHVEAVPFELVRIYAH